MARADLVLAAVLAVGSPVACQASALDLDTRYEQARVILSGDRLSMDTGEFQRTFAFNEGQLVTTGLQRGERVLTFENDLPDVFLPEISNQTPTGGDVSTEVVPDDGISPARLRVSVSTSLGSVTQTRICDLVPMSPMIGCSVRLDGVGALTFASTDTARNSMIESQDLQSGDVSPRADRVPLGSPHWQVETVRFKTATDHNDNLVFKTNVLPYRQLQALQGNILRASKDDAQLVVLRESPTGGDQVGYRGYDFTLDNSAATIAATGLEGDADGTAISYATVVGLSAPGDIAFTEDLRRYMETIRPFDISRDPVATSNSWGDRSRDARMTEAFILAEIDAAAELGLSHVQLDDGWQAGLSKNSARKEGEKWSDWSAEDWQTHPLRFPNGLGPIVDHAERKGIQIGLWFNPSLVEDYAAWKRDADILIDFYREYGISQVKIDGIHVPNRFAESRLRAFFERVTEATGGEMVFNVDVTAGRRPGYFHLNRYGTIFLENRYTDWGNYYPHRTLRNLWMLSHYVPPQWFQIEFLNTSRNPDNYEQDDPLVPANVGFDYAFATTMAAQPLAWMEVSNLPDDLAKTDVVKRYRTIWKDLQASRIYPIGEQPDGSSWTGFQATRTPTSGYFIVYREPGAPRAGSLRTRLSPDVRVELERLYPAEVQTLVVDDGSLLTLDLPDRPDFAVFRYSIR